MIDSDHQSSMVNKLRSLVGSVQRCIDIDWKSEYFRQDIDQTIPDLPELQDATSSLAPSAYFSQSMAVYSYMKEMNRQSQDLSISIVRGSALGESVAEAFSVRVL